MPNPKRLSLILHNVRSAYNVGSIFRSADAFGVSEITLTGISPYPKTKNDPRLPHVSTKADQMIAKTALGAEKTVPYRHMQINTAIAEFIRKGHKIYALEQANNSVDIRSFKAQFPSVLIVGNEVSGLSRTVLDSCDTVLEIPQFGNKESLNVAVATGIALFQLAKKPGK